MRVLRLARSRIPLFTASLGHFLHDLKVRPNKTIAIITFTDFFHVKISITLFIYFVF
ncbi:hypothetical protein AGMMS49592_2470 [Endomicrobiia bacterium]|nr:hypothetical protein AGMMS49592_2470 [Endomicrobiia bacterium]GHT53659.1 hypothetical protein AGMMS50233_00070 [Endomicrobiia bacterium]